ncbi:hypothetical protein ACFFRR_006226 [Megaselia abdita]
MGSSISNWVSSNGLDNWGSVCNWSNSLNNWSSVSNWSNSFYNWGSNDSSINQRFTVDNSVESVDWVSSIFDSPSETISIIQRVFTLDYISITSFELSLGVSGE